MIEICPICSTEFDQEILDAEDDANGVLTGLNIHQSDGYCSVACVQEYKNQFKPTVLKSRIDHTQVYTHQVIVPANENTVSIDVTDKVIASGIPPANIRIIGTPDYPVALGIKGRVDAGQHYLDIGIIPSHESDVVVTILAFALSE